MIVINQGTVCDNDNRTTEQFYKHGGMVEKEPTIDNITNKAKPDSMFHNIFMYFTYLI